MEGRREDFEKLLTNDLTIECLNSADSQGYNLLEWGTAFSSSDWPIDEELKLRGAEIPSVEGLFRRNVFFIALQYLPPNRKSQFLSLDRIDISGVNKMGDTALHLFLYEEEWKLAEEILNQFESYDVNITNSLEDTPLLLAARLNCEFGLFKKIVNRTNSENVNKADGTGNTALHYAMYNKSEIKVKELLNHKDVDVNVKNNEDNRTALHLASNWQYIPMDLFENILQRSADINAKDKYGNTALHLAIMFRLESDEFKINQLLGDVRVNVDIKNNEMDTALCLASKFLTRTRATTFPSDLFKKIIQNSADVNAQDKDGNTPLHIAILRQSEIGAKELLKHNDVNVAVENNLNQAVYRFDSRYWPDIPEDLAGKIYRKSVYYKNTMTYFIIGMFISTVLSICWFVFYE
jgi:ankyrin repeat protein